MWKEMSTDKFLYCKDVPSVHPSLFLFDFPAIIRKMKHTLSFLKTPCMPLDTRCFFVLGDHSLCNLKKMVFRLFSGYKFSKNIIKYFY